MKPTILIRSTLFTAICLLAAKLPSNAAVDVVNGSFEDSSSPYFLNGDNSYSDQYPAPGYAPFPSSVMFNGWEDNSIGGGYNYEEISTASFTGATSTYAVRGSNGPTAIESLNPVGTIDANATYTLTLALNLPSGIANSSFQLLATTQAFDTTDTYTRAGSAWTNALNPDPVITTLPGGVLADSGTLAGGSTTATAFQDYTISFDTLGTDNSAFVGKNLSILINLGNNGGTGAAVTDVSLAEVPAPEPSTWALLFAGVAGLLFIVRRKLQA